MDEWTSETPTRPGWYWFCTLKHLGGKWRSETEVLRVYTAEFDSHDARLGELCINGETGDYPTRAFSRPILDVLFRWQGPIPEPPAPAMSDE